MNQKQCCGNYVTSFSFKRMYYTTPKCTVSLSDSSVKDSRTDLPRGKFVNKRKGQPMDRKH